MAARSGSRKSWNVSGRWAWVNLDDSQLLIDPMLPSIRLVTRIR